MANQKKQASNIVLEVNISNNSKDKSVIKSLNAGVIVNKDYIEKESLNQAADLILEKAEDLATKNKIDANELPIVFENSNGSTNAIIEILNDRGFTAYKKSVSKKDKSYYGYSDDSYDYYYEPLTPYNVINFDELDQAAAAAELNDSYLTLFAQFSEMGQRIINGYYTLAFGDERGKLSLMTDLTQQFLNRLDSVTSQNNGDMRKEVTKASKNKLRVNKSGNKFCVQEQIKGVWTDNACFNDETDANTHMDSMTKEINYNPKSEEEAVAVVAEIIGDAVNTFTSENQPETNKETKLVVKSKGVVLFKNAQNELIWAGVHSNKFLDRDKDILKEESHKRFVEKVYSGDYEFPKLEIWHTGKAVGETNWLAYDDRGFLLSGGVVYPEFEELVTNLVTNTPEMGMSHGMPVDSVIYDDEGYIKEYKSVEVTMLPLENAANILTSFSVKVENE